MKKCICTLALCVLVVSGGSIRAAAPYSKPGPKFKVLVLTERGGGHEGFVAAALQWLGGFAGANRFEFTEINHTQKINAAFLSEYKVFLQLDFPPYMWSDESKAAFVEYIEKGKGGWVGFHHATLLGDFDGYPMWQWFSDFMGGIRFGNYIAQTASGTVNVEDAGHPVMKNVRASFTLHDDEWYTFDRNPRPNVRVLATVDEASYSPPSDIKMGDHPVVWVNPKMKARNVYFLVGHHPSLLRSTDFTTMFGNAILWAARK
ncbi:MAG: ThuA domain-containing protein [Bacteroidales bacterium]|jgi:type 1 glutamine amidotransferase|nr:ThuA domain-containing protein [Bacteroidales bacterium]